MPTNMVQARGAISGPTLTFAGTGIDIQALDGLDVTFETTDEVFLWFVLNLAWSLAPGIVSIIPELDGALRYQDAIDTSNWTTGGDQRSGGILIHCGNGTHRIRLMLVAANATVATLTARQRSLIVLSLAI